MVISVTSREHVITMPLRRLETIELDQLVRWLNAGLSQQEVAGRLQASQSVVSRAWNRYISTGSAAYTHGRGRERAKTPAEDRLVVLTV